MFRRRKAHNTGGDVASQPRCVMCGVDVSVDASGLCPIGHVVVAAGPPGPSTAGESTWSVEPDRGGVFTEPTIEMPAAGPLRVAQAAPASAAAEVGAHDVTTVLPGTTEVAQESAALHALDELLAYAGEGAGTISDDLASTLDVDPSYAGLEAVPYQNLSESNDAVETHAIAAPDDDVEDAVVARKRAAGLLGGGLLMLGALAGSIAILPPL